MEESFYYDWETVDKYLLEKLLKNKELIGHNIKFDWKYLIEKGMYLYDTVEMLDLKKNSFRK